MDEMHNKLKELLGDSQGAVKELAMAIGVHPNTVSNWKSGYSVSYHKYADKIAAHFGVTVDWLCGVPGAQKTPATQTDDEREIDIELANLLRRLPPDRVELVKEIARNLAKEE